MSGNIKNIKMVKNKRQNTEVEIRLKERCNLMGVPHCIYECIVKMSKVIEYYIFNFHYRSDEELIFVLTPEELSCYNDASYFEELGKSIFTSFHSTSRGRFASSYVFKMDEIEFH